MGGAVSSYFWVLQDALGKELRSTERFGDQQQAEDWMGREWASLRQEGAEFVVLKRDEDHIYRMSLSEE